MSLAIPARSDLSRRVAPAVLAIAAAILLGGSGSLVPGPEIVLQCLLAGLTASWIWLSPGSLRQVPRGAWIVAGLLVVLPLAQLVPLPSALWQALPGRGVERAALALVGAEKDWEPLSLTPDRTLAALLAMAAAAAVLVMASAQHRRGRTMLMATVAAIALLSVLVGAAQLSGGAGNRFRFYYPDDAFLNGFQTNHNAQGDVLLIGLVMLAAAAADWAGWRRRYAVDPRLLLGGVGGSSLLLVLGVLLTASRIAIALLPIAIGAQVLILRRWLVPLRGAMGMTRRRMAIAGIALLVVLALALVLGQHGALARVWARFHIATELRPQIWHDAWFALRQVWPWGAGMGSFTPVFAAAERLEVVSQQFVNRAHDDYLEFLIEAGLPGVVAFGLILARLAQDGWRSWQAKAAGSRAQMIGGAAGLLIIAAHSLGDYPLRTLSIACMSALCAGVLLPVAAGTERGT